MRTRLVLFVLGGSLLPLTLVGWLAIREADQVLLEAVEHQLLATLEIKKTEVEREVRGLGTQLAELASRPRVVQAMVAFKEAFFAPPVRGEDRELLRRTAEHRFESRFLPEYRRLNRGRAATSGYLSLLDETALRWQFWWPEGEGRDGAGRPGSGGEGDYERVHDLYHEIFHALLGRHDLHDLFLVDPESGRVVYSVLREVDFATSLIDGPFAGSGLGEAFRRARAVEASTAEPRVLVDHAPHFPSLDRPSAFLAHPLREGGKLVGVLVAQLDGEGLDRIVGETVGLGRTEEVTLVGLVGDQVFYRSNRSREHERIGERVPGFSAEAVRVGQARVWIRRDGEERVRALVPLALPGVTWAMTGSIALDEAMQPAEHLDRLLLATLAVVLVVASFVGLRFGRMLLQPLKGLAGAAQRIANGEWSARVRELAEDEIGQTGVVFNLMAERV
ncbi:MAG: HAMP domain-containing protein, partial [Magnetococcales bacterium]|nr:HAMP domain-containing protein [Magnetococcales bacterium]